MSLLRQGFEARARPWVPIDLLQDDADLEADEGFSATPYQDTVGVWTNGFGNTQDVGPDTPPVTRAEALVQLQANFASTTARLAATLPWITRLNPVRQDVLVEMAFNLGVAGLLNFHVMLADSKSGRFDMAAAAMLMSEWAGQVGDHATRLSILMTTGVRPETLKGDHT